MIIWLASYPKSGNTWLRFFIISLLLKDNNEVGLKHLEGIKQFPTNYHYKNFNISKSDFSSLNKISKHWIDAQKVINSDNKIRFFKTHNALLKLDNNIFTNEENTLGTKIKNCLFSQSETDLLTAYRANIDIEKLIINSIEQKEKQRGGAREFDNEFVENMKNRSMVAIGG